MIDGAPVWPIFRWSKDDKYFARIGTNMLSVYETPVSYQKPKISSELLSLIGFFAVVRLIRQEEYSSKRY